MNCQPPENHSLSEYLLDLLFKLCLVCAIAFPIIAGIAFAFPASAYTATQDPDDTVPVFAPSEIRFDTMYTGGFSIANAPEAVDIQPLEPMEYYNEAGDLLCIDSTSATSVGGFVTYSRYLQTPDFGDLVGVTLRYSGVDPWFLRSDGPYQASGLAFSFDNSAPDMRLIVSVRYSYYDSEGYYRSGLASRAYMDIGGTLRYFIRDELASIFSANDVPYASSGFYIDELVFAFDSPDGSFGSGFTFTSVDGGALGVSIAPRYLPDIRKQYVTPDVLAWLRESVDGFLTQPFFGSDFTLGGIIAVMLSLPLVVWFLRLIAGG